LRASSSPLAARISFLGGRTGKGKMAKVPELKNQTGNVPAVGSTEIENILGAAQEDAGFEKLLKFRKGQYFIGEELVPLGTEYIAHAKAWVKCWIKFVDGKVVERKVYRVALGERPPEREDLGDLEKDNWPEGIDGNPADPWALQYIVPFENIASGDVVVFVTPSKGGRRAVADLCAAYAKRTTKSASFGQPIVKLDVTDMPSKKYAKVPRPQFTVIGWDEASKDVDIMPPAGTSEGEFDDSIPF
jgi:hypothetical protein